MAKMVNNGLESSRSNFVSTYTWNWIGDDSTPTADTHTTIQGDLLDTTGFAQGDYSLDDSVNGERSANITVTHIGSEITSSSVTVREAALFNSDQGGSEGMAARGAFDTEATMTSDDTLEVDWTITFSNV